VVRASVSFLLVFALGLSGCRPEEAYVSAPQQRRRVVKKVVARVGKRPIGASDVAARMSSKDLDAETALAQLIDEELLVQEAIRRGITEDAEAQRNAERLMVRAMLHDFEKDLTPESIPMDEVRADFAAHQEQFQVPERRRSWHILVKDTGEAGRALAESILAEVRQADDPKAVYARYAGARGAQSTPEVTAEELPAITVKAEIEKPYKDALFAAKSKGPLKNVVRTSYGWHVIVLTEIVPGESHTLRDVEDEIRTRLSQKKRFEKLAETVRALEAEGLVQYDDQGVQRLLSMPGLPEHAE
jgi:parvulin-like peptidyl-prolyl isomerase